MYIFEKFGTMMAFQKRSKSTLFVVGYFVSAALQLVGADTISVINADDSSCIGRGDAIRISFDKDTDDNFDTNWIAVVPAGNTRVGQSLSTVELWSWLCGTVNCNPSTNPPAGTIELGASHGWTSSSWPLDSGSYQAVLTRGEDGQNWPVLAISESFQVGCGDDNTDDATRNSPTVVPSTSVIRNARQDIERLISRNPLLVGKFLRLAFHDCVGGCDGCVDMSNLDNAGLVMPITDLQPIVEEYESSGLSRTDVWMLAAVVASEVSDTVRGIGFPFRWVGRKTCEDINGDSCGRDSEGRPASCGPFNGPHRALCHGDTAGTETIRQFMEDEFGFDAQQTTAIMGAHTVGAMRDVNVGFEGRRGWDITNGILDHGYFLELVDPTAPNWRQVRHNNNNLDGIPSRWQFEATVGNIPLTMLNSDIAMVRNLVEGENLNSQGRVTCDFRECDGNTPFRPFVEEYARDLDGFLQDYREALDMMIDNGYSRDSTCRSGNVCVLRSRM